MKQCNSGKSSISIFQEIFISTDKIFISKGGLSPRQLFYEILRFFWYSLISLVFFSCVVALACPATKMPYKHTLDTNTLALKTIVLLKILLNESKIRVQSLILAPGKKPSYFRRKRLHNGNSCPAWNWKNFLKVTVVLKLGSIL